MALSLMAPWQTGLADMLEDPRYFEFGECVIRGCGRLDFGSWWINPTYIQLKPRRNSPRIDHHLQYAHQATWPRQLSSHLPIYKCSSTVCLAIVPVWAATTVYNSPMVGPLTDRRSMEDQWLRRYFDFLRKKGRSHGPLVRTCEILCPCNIWEKLVDFPEFS